MTAPAVRDEAFIRARVRVDPGTECWIWRGFVGVRGTRAVYNSEYAYRIAYRVFVGEIPDGLQINHHCDNGLCVNPAHLYAGTQQQNMRDAIVRSRLSVPTASGEGVHNAYSDRLVDEVRARYSQGERQLDLAERFGVSLGTVRGWVSGGRRDRAPILRQRGACGTRSGYASHRRRGESPCDECREANSSYMRDYKAKRRLAA